MTTAALTTVSLTNNVFQDIGNFPLNFPFEIPPGSVLDGMYVYDLTTPQCLSSPIQVSYQNGRPTATQVMLGTPVNVQIVCSPSASSGPGSATVQFTTGTESLGLLSTVKVGQRIYDSNGFIPATANITHISIVGNVYTFTLSQSISGGTVDNTDLCEIGGVSVGDAILFSNYELLSTSVAAGSGTNTLTFSSIPVGLVKVGYNIVNVTTAGVIPTSAYVTAVTSTTVTSSQNFTSGGVKKGDLIAFVPQLIASQQTLPASTTITFSALPEVPWIHVGSEVVDITSGQTLAVNQGIAVQSINYGTATITLTGALTVPFLGSPNATSASGTNKIQFSSGTLSFAQANSFIGRPIDDHLAGNGFIPVGSIITNATTAGGNVTITISQNISGGSVDATDTIVIGGVAVGDAIAFNDYLTLTNSVSGYGISVAVAVEVTGAHG